MPWKETSVMDQKVQLISDWLSEEHHITELSEIYGVSRPTVYKWISRYRKASVNGLEELSRAPKRHPNKTGQELIEEIVKLKLRRQKWGPKKVIARLRRNQPEKEWPTPSTAGEILKREGLVKKRKIRRKTPPYTEPFGECDKPNKVWSADYKGHFRTGDRRYCYPLTITDNNSRYLLRCQGLARPGYKETQPWFEWSFREYGLPEAIRTDNGTPFASVGLGGLSRLSVWFIKLGIVPERIDLGHPEQNGRHERMHRTLKEYTANPPKVNMREQQESFEDFKYEYNFERPHEALDQETPASIYYPSARECPNKIPPVEYDDDVEVRRVFSGGEVKWRGKYIYISRALAGESIAFKQIDCKKWEISFSFQFLGALHEDIDMIIAKH